MRVAVIGGGVAGLSAAHALLAGGADPVVFEAADRAGGQVGSVSERGWLTEDGPHFVSRPVDSLPGLPDEVVEPRQPATRWVHLGGRVFKAPSLGLLARAGVPRALLEPLVAKPLGEDMPLRRFLVERLGSRAGSLAAAVLAAGVYAGDPDRLSARDAFPSLTARRSLFARRPRSRLWNLRRGLGSLPIAAAEKLRVRLRAPVERLQPGWNVEGEKFDAVVLAIPASRAAWLTRGFAPPLAQALSSFESQPVTVVHLGFPHQQTPRGFGMIDADGTLHAVGTLFPSSMLPGRAPDGKSLVTAICRGEGDAGRVLADLRATFGVTGDPEYVRIVRHPEGIPQYTVGHRDRVQAARALLPPGLELAGASYDGVAVPDAARSGASAADRLLRTRSRS